MKIRNIAGLFVLIAVVSGCGIYERVSRSVSDSGTAGEPDALWADVPQFPGSTKSAASLPFLVRKIVETVISSSAQGSGNFELQSFDFIGYTTDAAPEEVEKYYTPELMEQNGWNDPDQPGCNAGDNSQMQGSSFCMYMKRDGENLSIVAIIATRSGETEPTNIFYVRASGIDKKNAPAGENTF